jgi:uncharacterized membrane protein
LPSTYEAAVRAAARLARLQSDERKVVTSTGGGSSTMATLTVWRFDTPAGAEHAVKTLEGLAEEDLIHIHDAAIVSWPSGKKKPKTHQLHSTLTKVGALRGAFWGLLFGLLFFMPLAGIAFGAAAGAATGALADIGIDDGFIKSVQDRVTPGTSALFVLTSDAVLDKAAAAFKATGAELIQTSLSAEEEARLREAFAEDDHE